MRKVAFAAVLGLGILAAQEPVIRGGVQLVDLLVSVRDKKGAVVKNLDQSSFAVYEDGVKQEIRRFSRETDLPLTIGMLVDVSGSVQSELDEEKRAARQFFDQVLRPQDKAFIISFERSATLIQDTTDSVRKLQEGLDELKTTRRVDASAPDVILAQFPSPRFPLPVPNGRGSPIPGGGGGGPGSPGPRRGGTLQIGGTVLYDAVFLAADEVLQPLSGRKAIILITDGDDQGSRVTLSRALQASLKSDVIIYSIFVKADRNGAGNEQALESLSGDTGGRVFRMQRNLSKIFDEINEELRSQYSISYSPSEQSYEGDYRRIEVRVAQKDHKVQARKGYYAKASEELPAAESRR